MPDSTEWLVGPQERATRRAERPSNVGLFSGGGSQRRTGRHVMRIALDRGHTVTAVVRAPERLADVDPTKHNGLRVCVDNPCEAANLERLLPTHDAVISALGPRRPTTKACAIYGDSGRAIATAMMRTSVRRVLVTSSALVFPEQAFMGRLLRRLVPAIVAGATALETAIGTPDLDWTVARTGFLNDKPNPAYAVLPDRGGTIAREGLATFLVDELEGARHVQQAVGLATSVP